MPQYYFCSEKEGRKLKIALGNELEISLDKVVNLAHQEGIAHKIPDSEWYVKCADEIIYGSSEAYKKDLERKKHLENKMIQNSQPQPVIIHTGLIGLVYGLFSFVK
jgi:hypothetical protein